MTLWLTHTIQLKEVFGYGPLVAELFGGVGLPGSVAT
jgi:hypothetical protein